MAGISNYRKVWELSCRKGPSLNTRFVPPARKGPTSTLIERENKRRVRVVSRTYLGPG